MDIRHIKITSSEGLFRINDKKAFKGLVVSLNLMAESNCWASQTLESTVYTVLAIIEDDPEYKTTILFMYVTGSFIIVPYIVYMFT